MLLGYSPIADILGRVRWTEFVEDQLAHVWGDQGMRQG